MTPDIQPETEASPRRASLAFLLSFAAPGLGLVYAGELLAGVSLNLAMVLVFLLVIVAVTWWQLVLTYAAFATLAAWLVLTLLAALRAAEHTRDAGRPRAFQHPLIYGLIALLTFVGPMAIVVDQALRHLWTFQRIDTMAMYPLAHPGDTLLIRRVPEQVASPQRGELIAVRTPHTDELATLRVVALPGEEVQMQGNTLIIGDQLVDYTPLMEDWVGEADLRNEQGLNAWVEHNHDRRYVVAISDRTSTEAAIPGLALGPHQYFVLADNRSHLSGLTVEDRLTADSRLFGPLPAERIVGRPVHIAWSSTEGESPRWERIGLPLH
ncbi:signal peptidase I [Lujinxingia litoralis]|uniref:Signal peptidase I n=1 Tax=Lujinxingia litoralis TaxID=2211119 RepID=A0A328C781_9DELT|nr:signal peptidase I [Lujinxingia litoralis]RAL23815.1 signal peptidase I [Lujinxingia litoralis]